ncbi:CCA tRNA nucleotidyltransferase [Patescibacteria group bacterium]|nr:CCA tRNA nucleotidyltransferase [Patescibacteria group bacterium]
MQLDNLANRIARQFRRRGFVFYLVGGAVRDRLLGRPVSDIDCATDAKPAQTIAILRQMKLASYKSGEKFGTIGVAGKEGKIEITTFRIEGMYKDSRRPSKVRFVSDPAVDASRRDFTVNAMFYDPLTGEIMDFYGGAKDLALLKINFVGNASGRIKEDPLRMLRAARLSCQLGFTVSGEASRAITKNAALIRKISGQRIKEETDKLLQSENYTDGIRFLDKTGLLKYIFPEVDNLKRVKQSKDFHSEGNAFKHTMLCMDNAAGCDLDLKYAVLFHDIGKADSAKAGRRNGKPHISFRGHGQSGEKMFSEIAARYPFSRRQYKKISYLIGHHMDLLRLDLINSKTLVKWAKNDDFGDLIRLRMIDTAGSIMASDKEGLRIRENKAHATLLKEWSRLNAEKNRTLVDGEEIKKVLNIKAGPRVGYVLDEIKRMQILGKIKTKQQAKKYLLSLTRKTK